MAESDQVPDKVSVQELETEFGLEGNTDAAESDKANADPGNLDSIEKETTEADGVDTTAIERHISDEEALRGIDDNVELAKVQAKLDQEAADAAALDEKVVDDAVKGDLEDAAGKPEVDDDASKDAAAKDEAGDDEAKADAAKTGAEEKEGEEKPDGDVEGGKKPGDAAAEGDKKAAAEADAGGDEHEQNLNKWLESNLDDEGADDMTAALVRKNANVTFKSDGEMVTIPLQEALKRAAGYAGQETVDARSQKAGVDLKAAEDIKTAAEATAQRAEDTVKTVTEQIDDVEKFGAFLTGRADLEYLTKLRDHLDATITGAEDNPQGFAMNRRLTGIESALGQLLNGGDPAAEGNTDRGAGPEAKETTQGDPASIPDDLGFIRGQGYPAKFTQLARRDTETALNAARAVGGPDVAYDAVVDVWVKEGRTRPITEVAEGLLKSGVRNSSKKKIAEKPPTRSKTPSRVTTQKEKSAIEAPVGERDWDDIPGIIEKQLKADLAP